MSDGLPQIDSIPETCRWSGLDPQHLYRLVNNGVIPPGVAITLGRRKFINRERFIDWLDSGGAAYAGGWRREAPAKTGTSSTR